MQTWKRAPVAPEFKACDYLKAKRDGNLRESCCSISWRETRAEIQRMCSVYLGMKTLGRMRTRFQLARIHDLIRL